MTMSVYGGEVTLTETKVLPRFKNLAQCTPQNIKETKEQIKSILLQVDKNEERRHLPFHKRVILELNECGFEDVSQYLTRLFDIEEAMRQEAGIGAKIWLMPKLKDEKELIETLKCGLIAAKASKDNHVKRVAALLETALYFQSKTWEWWWITDELFNLTLNLIESLSCVECRTLATVHHLYGKFLFVNMKDIERSLTHLTEAKELSHDKWWNLSQFLNKKQDNIYRETCAVLYQVLFKLAEEMVISDGSQCFEIALKISEEALTLARDTVHEEILADAFHKYGKIEFAIGQFTEAIQSVSAFIRISEKVQNPEEICNGHSTLFTFYKELKDNENALKHLNLYRLRAEENNLEEKLAHAHYLSGQFLMNKPLEATKSLDTAFSLYKHLAMEEEKNLARCFAAVAKGQSLMKEYTSLILDSHNSPEKLKKLCDWKNSRIPFWKDDEE